MNIWIVNPFDDPFPGEGQKPGRYISLVRELVSRGHRVVWWSSTYAHGSKSFRTAGPKMDGLDVRLVPVPPYARNVGVARLYNHFQLARRFASLAAQLIQEVPTARPKVVFSSLPPLELPYQATRVGHACGARVIIDVQDAWPDAFDRFVPGSSRFPVAARVALAPLRLLARSIFFGADAISGVAEAYVALTHACERGIPFHVARLGVFLERVDRILQDRTKAGCDAPTFVYVGSLSSNYDMKTFLRAVHHLNGTGRTFKVEIAGRGEHEPELRALAGALELHNVTFHGYLGYEEMIHLLSRSQVAVNPIRVESRAAFPNKVGDYCSAGLPLVNSISGELDLMLREYSAGQWYCSGDVHSLATAMARYIDEPARIKTEGQNARKLAEDHLEQRRICADLADFIELVSSTSERVMKP